MKAYLEQQYDYHVWANEKVFDRLKELPEEVYTREVQSVFSTIHKAMEHIYVIDSGWLDLMASGGVSEMTPAYIERLQASVKRLTDATAGKNAAQMQELFRELAERFRPCLDGLHNLEGLCAYGAFEARYADLIQHVVNHGTYHRGNIAAMLRQMGHSGTQTDYSLYLYTMKR
ncbi:DinB family protein [Paenibacillus arenilitoris]|uniref:DinB family protein n=1 Tax=Paenibacillus arenilitoris TaxID=2772299 RepID=A0A927CTB3_9BACL|nr:DinB family protein [Paenibacillus arenilitoris]MBD2872842.1 DinB family protein [Paenibacillus arenilitoris]